MKLPLVIVVGLLCEQAALKLWPIANIAVEDSAGDCLGSIAPVNLWCVFPLRRSWASNPMALAIRVQDIGGANGHSKDLEAGPAGPSEADRNLQQFFDEVAEIKSQMAAIRRNLHKLQDANEESKQVTRAPDMKGEPTPHSGRMCV